MEVALSRSDRCLTLLSTCQDHIQNGRARDALATVKVIRSEGRGFENAMKGSLSELQVLQSRQKKQLDDLTDREYELRNDIKRKKADVVRYQQEADDHERDIRRFESDIRDAQSDWERYNREYQEAKEKLEDLAKWWWVPVYGQILLIQNIVELNFVKMGVASERKNRSEERKSDAKRRRNDAKSMITKAKREVEEAEREIRKCDQGEKECHQKCTEVRCSISKISEGQQVLTNVLALTESACSNTDTLKQIFEHAERDKKLLKSRGTAMKMEHVGKGWKDVNDTVSSNRRLLQSKALTGSM